MSLRKKACDLRDECHAAFQRAIEGDNPSCNRDFKILPNSTTFQTEIDNKELDVLVEFIDLMINYFNKSINYNL